MKRILILLVVTFGFCGMAHAWSRFDQQEQAEDDARLQREIAAQNQRIQERGDRLGSLLAERNNTTVYFDASARPSGFGMHSANPGEWILGTGQTCIDLWGGGVYCNGGARGISDRELDKIFGK